MSLYICICVYVINIGDCRGQCGHGAADSGAKVERKSEESIHEHAHGEGQRQKEGQGRVPF